MGNVAKTYGTWRNLYATGMAEQAAGKELAAKAGKALRVAGAVTAAVSAVVAAMDLVDANESRHQKRWELMWLQGVSGVAGIGAASFAFWAVWSTAEVSPMLLGLELTGWGVVLAVLLVALTMLVDRVKGDNFAQWLERCYWGAPPSGRYIDATTEQNDFNLAMVGA